MSYGNGYGTYANREAYRNGSIGGGSHYNEDIDAGEEHEGMIKSFDDVKGYGFIKSTAVYEQYGGVDAFLHRKQLGSFKVADNVRFHVRINTKGQPQAFDLSVALPQQVPQHRQPPGSWTEASQPSASSTTAAHLGRQQSSSASNWLMGSGPEEARARPFDGTIRFFDESQGLGFIAVSGMQDVHVSREEIVNFSVGDHVAFFLRSTATGLAAHDLCRLPMANEVAAAASTSYQLSADRPLYTEGFVKSFDSDKGYGFIVCSQANYLWGGGDVYVHRSQIKGFKPGDYVRLGVRANERTGKPQAQELSSNRPAKEEDIQKPVTPTPSSVATPPVSSAECAESSLSSAAAALGLSLDPDVAKRIVIGNDADKKVDLSKPPRQRGRGRRGRQEPLIIHQGTVKMVDFEKGWGFIKCQELHDIYRCDMFVDKQHLEDGGFDVGDPVLFRLQIARTSKPKAIGLHHPVDEEGETLAGKIKSFDRGNGFGFISCQEATEKYSRDVFLHQKQIKHYQVGDNVRFKIRINEKGHPQAYRLDDVPETVAWLGVEEPGAGPQADNEEEFEGEVKSFSRNDGYGFIDCPQLRERFDRDVYLNQSEQNGCGIGDRVRFKVKVKRGHPKAVDVVLVVAGPRRGQDRPKTLGNLSDMEEATLNRKLLRACASAKVESVDDMEQLLEAGANPSARDVTGQAALMVCALNVRHSERKCRVLMYAEADPTMTALPEDEIGEDDNPQTILEWMRERINPKFADYLEALYNGDDPDCDLTCDRPDDDF